MLPNQALHLTGSAILVSRGIKLLQRPRHVSLVDFEAVNVSIEVASGEVLPRSFRARGLK